MNVRFTLAGESTLSGNNWVYTGSVCGHSESVARNIFPNRQSQCPTRYFHVVGM